MINGGSSFFEKASHFFQDFSRRNIFFSDKRFFGCFPDLAVDAVIGTNFVRDEVNPERPSQSPRRNGTVKVTINFHLFAPCAMPYTLCEFRLQIFLTSIRSPPGHQGSALRLMESCDLSPQAPSP